MNIAIVYGGSFPCGGLASAQHILSYSKGLIKLGHNVCVLTLQPTKKKNIPSNTNTQVNGMYEGVDYYYPSRTIYWPEGLFSVFKKIAIKIKNVFGVYKYLIKNNIDVVVFVISEGLDYRIWALVCRLSHYRFVIERTELSPVYKDQQLYNSYIRGRLYKRFVEKGFSYPDSWIVETQTLQDYYQHFAKKKADFYILPMTVEVDRFCTSTKANKTEDEYLAYCGNMREDDGITILIEAFKKISDAYPDLKLKLAGYSNDTPKQKELVQKLGLEERVCFLGRIDRESIPVFLINAKLLVLASPTSLRSCATMPCKVGEYLCTSVPVVVTALGEINRYLKDGVSAYLAKPDSSDSFAEKLNEALSDSENRRFEIGKRGQKVAVDNFSADTQARCLENIFLSINDLL